MPPAAVLTGACRYILLHAVTTRYCNATYCYRRLDWLAWFLPFSGARNHPWLYHLVAKLLENDERASSLLAHNPFVDGAPPKFIRAVLYEYSFASPEQARPPSVHSMHLHVCLCAHVGLLRLHAVHPGGSPLKLARRA